MRPQTNESFPCESAIMSSISFLCRFRLTNSRLASRSSRSAPFGSSLHPSFKVTNSHSTSCSPSSRTALFYYFLHSCLVAPISMSSHSSVSACWYLVEYSISRSTLWILFSKNSETDDDTDLLVMALSVRTCIFLKDQAEIFR